MIRPLLQQRERADPVPAADDHDADLLGREALGHDRAAAHLAAHRLRDHRSASSSARSGCIVGLLARDADLHRASCSSTATRSGSRSSSGYLGPAAARQLLHLDRASSSRARRRTRWSPARRRSSSRLMFWIINWFADSAGPTASAMLIVPVDHRALRRLRQGRHRHEAPRLLPELHRRSGCS